MTGMIHLNIYNHYNCAALAIEITGEEKVKWTAKEKNKEKEEHDKLCKANNKFLRICHILQRFDTKLVLPG